jgi:BlaI family penicillinase repressor
LSTKLKPTESELEILQILWREGSLTVKDVHKIVSQKRDIGYTTSLKIMQIMADKNLCSRELKGKTHVYTALVREEDVQNGFIDNIIKQVFQGSAMELVMQTLGNYKANKSEIADLKSFISKMENENK